MKIIIKRRLNYGTNITKDIQTKSSEYVSGFSLRGKMVHYTGKVLTRYNPVRSASFGRLVCLRRKLRRKGSNNRKNFKYINLDLEENKQQQQTVSQDDQVEEEVLDFETYDTVIKGE